MRERSTEIKLPPHAASSIWAHAGHLLLTMFTACFIGACGTGFLFSLSWVTHYREAHPGILFLLPMAGMIVAWLYQHWFSPCEDLTLLDHENPPTKKASLLLAPSILFSTLNTHLFGGSTGREGTALQMGGGIAAAVSVFGKVDRTLMIRSGMAAGFSAVFGVPIAACVFVLETHSPKYHYLSNTIQIIASSFIADMVCRKLGGTHTDFHALIQKFNFSWHLIWQSMLLGIICVLIGMFYRNISKNTKKILVFLAPNPILRAMCAACTIIGLTNLSGTRDYLGLGAVSAHEHAVSIVSSFSAGGANVAAWLWKIIFTTVTTQGGFKGGEVTPLFFIGATAGNAFSSLLHAPVSLCAAIGMMMVFSFVSRSPLACVVMGIEIFGWSCAPWLALAGLIVFLSTRK